MNKIKQISGTWYSFYWNDLRHHYWNDACVRFTEAQWKQQIEDLYKMGIRDIIIFNVMIDDVAVYPSKFKKMYPFVCSNPLEAVMQQADELDMRIYMTNDYVNGDDFNDVMSKECIYMRNQVIEELVALYGHHKSFYGWYWAFEACISPYYTERFIQYVNENSKTARSLMPHSTILTAPYGTKNAVCDVHYLHQLEKMDVDIIAYQDTVGCYQLDIDGSKRAFEILRKAHDKVPQRKLYADVETFAWEGPDNRKETPLIPAPIHRLTAQLEAVSPFVDQIYAFIVQGLMTDENSIAYTNYKAGAQYYNEYMHFLNSLKMNL